MGHFGDESYSNDEVMDVLSYRTKAEKITKPQLIARIKWVKIAKKGIPRDELAEILLGMILWGVRKRRLRLPLELLEEAKGYAELLVQHRDYLACWGDGSREGELRREIRDFERAIEKAKDIEVSQLEKEVQQKQARIKKLRSK